MKASPRGRVFLAFLPILLAACGIPGEGGEEVIRRPAGRPSPSDALTEVESWGYQLQRIDLDQLAASDFDLLVIDYADDSGQPFPPEDIAWLRADGKLVVSYLSIGEAETYRPYWDPTWVEGDECDAPPSASAPRWLEGVNPEWCGNYLVQYWDPEWQAIVMDYLDAILAAGFDGVYLDKVDSFYTWTGEEDLGAPFTHPGAGPDMAALVETIAARGRAVHPGFIVVPQNAVEIIEYLDGAQRAEYLATISGIAVEDTFFRPIGAWDENAAYNPQQYVIGLLAEYQAAGLPVFAVDYVTEPRKIARFAEEARAHGYIPYAGVRALNALMPPP